MNYICFNKSQDMYEEIFRIISGSKWVNSFAIESPFNEWVISVFCDLNPLSLTCIKGSHVRLACHLRNKLLAKSQEREQVLLEWLKL